MTSMGVPERWAPSMPMDPCSSPTPVCSITACMRPVIEV